MVILQISNQRSFYYLRIDDIRNIGFVWQKLSEVDYYKLHGYYTFSDNEDDCMKFRKSPYYYDSLDDFLNKNEMK